MSSAIKGFLKAASLFSLLTLSACSSWMAPREIPELPLLNPDELGYSLQLTQQVQVITAGDKQTLLAAWVVADHALSFVGLTPTGQRLLALNYDGKNFSEDYSDMLEQPLPGRDIIAYMQLAHWPQDSIERALAATDWHLEIFGDQRQLWLKNHLVLTIDRTLTGNKVGTQTITYPLTVNIHSQVTDFQLMVNTVQVASP